MNIDWEKVEIKELVGIISSHLQKNDIEVVLVGGACVSLYSENQYTSYDIDLITDTPIRKITPVLKELGFKNTGSRLFENPKCRFLIDFPAPPVSVGDERPVAEFNYLNTQFGTICLLTPTDCIKDRLAAYFFWNDNQSFNQAVLVAKTNKISFHEIKKWAERLDELEKYEIFKKKCSEEGLLI